MPANGLTKANKEIKITLIATAVIALMVLAMYAFTPAKQAAATSEQANTQQAQEITNYIKQNYGAPNFTASWYYSIEHIGINQTEKQRTIEISTTTEQRNSPVGNNICNAVSNYWQNHKNSFTGIIVIGMGGEITNYRYSLNSKCS